MQDGDDPHICEGTGRWVPARTIHVPNERAKRTNAIIMNDLQGQMNRRSWEGCSLQKILAFTGWRTARKGFDKESHCTGKKHLEVRGTKWQELVPLANLRFAQSLRTHGCAPKNLCEGMFIFDYYLMQLFGA